MFGGKSAAGQEGFGTIILAAEAVAWRHAALDLVEGQRDMADFTGDPVAARDEFAVDDKTAADARAENDSEDAGHARGGTVHRL